ncbi:alpha/beta fold hydrolase [Allosalinactinospora lopnorensis]|uniref:alpha/beta fold hydrolase n=1 Tax=Allosalinactinospora lopnorensis TaxID=1352348 RepID=UPI000623F548|nr:alpha/beta hydrolase [Allosalinactinospora lopnorensis]
MDWTLGQRHETAQGIVRWESWGGGSPVVLLHGTPFSSYVWRDIAAALATRYQVFVWDMPGYGQSEMRRDQDVSLAAQGRLFVDLLAHWGLHRPRVVAHDFGGAVALRAHLLHGVLYARLALLDAVAVAPWGSPFFRLVAQHADVFGQLPEALHRALVREYVTSASSRGLRPDVLDRLVEPWLGELGQSAFYRQIAQNDQRYTDEIQGRYGELGLPVLVGWGSDDTWLPPERGRALASQIPGARLEMIAEAGHLVQEDAPVQVATLLGDFLGEE